MYIAPRPNADDDPYFALRLALGAALAILIAVLIESKMPILLPIGIIALQGGIRKAFDIKKAVISPLVLIGVTWVFYIALAYLHVMPIITVILVYWVCVMGYLITLKTGNPAGMLIIILIVFMSVMASKSTQALVIVRDGFLEALISAIILIPLLFALLPTKAKTPLIETFPSDSYGLLLPRAMLRALVLLLLLSTLYTVLDQDHLLLAIAAVFALVFPCKEHQFQEARERCFATLLGGVLALSILLIMSYVGHLIALLLLTLATGLYLGQKMVSGQHPPMVYQFAFSVCVTLVVGSLANQSPLQLTLLRLTLTLGGAMGAAFLYAALEGVLFKEKSFHTGPKNPI